MADRRNEPIYQTRITLGNVLTIIGGLGALAAILIAIGAYKGGMDTWRMGVDATLSNQRVMLHDMGEKIDGLGLTVAGIDAKLNAALPVKRAGMQ